MGRPPDSRTCGGHGTHRQHDAHRQQHDRAHRRWRPRGCRRGGPRGAQELRIRRVVAPGPGRAQADHAALDRPARRARRRTRRAGLRGRRQADQRMPEHGPARHAGYLALVRRSHRQVLWAHLPNRVRCPGTDRQGSHRRGRRGPAVELPRADVRMESRPRAGRGQCRHRQARRTDLAERLPDDAAGPRGRHPAGHIDPGHRTGRIRRRTPGSPHGRRHGVLHRIDGGGALLPQVLGREQPEGDRPGMRRQEPSGDFRGRGPGRHPRPARGRGCRPGPRRSGT